MLTFSFRVFQGEATTFTVTLPGATYQGTETLTCVINDGSTNAALLTLTPTWASGQTTGQYKIINVAFSSANASALPVGFYIALIGIAAGAAPLAYGLVEIYGTAGGTPTLDSFVTPAQVIGQVPEIASNADQIAAVPVMLQTATATIRRWLNDQHINQATYTEYLPVLLNGYVRCSQAYVQEIASVQSDLDQALQITNGSAQFSSVSFSYTGDLLQGQTVTGLNLNSTTNGTPATSNVAFSANETISTLATAINGVGGGWTALAEGTYGSWPVTELYNGFVGQGATQNGCILGVFSNFISNACFHPDDGQRTGMIWVGERQWGVGPRWGWGWQDIDNLQSQQPALVKVTYTAGFATVPYQIQFATLELCKAMLLRMKIDPYLISEQAADYRYQQALNMLNALPQYVREGLAAYRVTNA